MSGVRYEVFIDEDQLEAVLSRFKEVPKQVPTIVYRASTRAAESARTEGGRQIKARYRIRHSANEIKRKYMFVNKSSISGLSELLTRGYKEPLASFDYDPKNFMAVAGQGYRGRPRYKTVVGADGKKKKVIDRYGRTASRPPASIKAMVLKGESGGPLLGDSAHSKGFVAQMKSGHIGIFERVLRSADTRSARSRRFGAGRWAKTAEGKDAITQRYGPAVPEMLGKVIEPVQERMHEVFFRRINGDLDRLLGR